MERIADALTGHASLTNFKLFHIGGASGSQLGEAFGRVLASNTVIKTIGLSRCNLDDTGAVALSKGLRCNSTLAPFGANGAAAIADSLRQNTALKRLYLPPVGCLGAESVAQILASNSTTEDINIYGLDAAGLSTFSSHLPKMNGVRYLSLHKLSGLTQQSKNSFLESLERNTELNHIRLSAVDDLGDMLIVHEMDLKAEIEMVSNRAGKRILKSNNRVPKCFLASHT